MVVRYGPLSRSASQAEADAVSGMLYPAVRAMSSSVRVRPVAPTVRFVSSEMSTEVR